MQNWNQPYVVTAGISSSPSGGSDVETDDRYRIRLYKLPKGLSTCGTKESYEFYALLANPSISQVAVYSDRGSPARLALRRLWTGAASLRKWSLIGL